MNKQEFIKLLENAQVDEFGNLYYYEEDDEIENRIYFATVTTICDDFVENYCYQDSKGNYEHYNRHFSPSDDTFEVKIVNNKE
jgi:hypothetical protein